jgi:alginate O-acetyltransferase complex protein AlgI
VVFSSIIFLFYFLPVFLLGYYVSGWRTGFLLIGSVAFYTWGEGAYVLLLGALILANYVAAIVVGGARDARRGRVALVLAVALDLGVLGFFKYAGFLAHNLNLVLPFPMLPEPHLRLPLGISFFTFQLISYLMDVSRRTVRVVGGLTRFAAYILMFPHLIAGPIVRYADIRDEMHADRRGSQTVALGLQYLIVGLCQKVLIANVVAPVADHAFGLAPGALDVPTAWAGAIAYALQIYFDFCGYSNMAIGLAFLLGFTFPKNFNYPYVSRSITEFWRRWHISLSSWFRDYVYIPLGGNRHGQAQTLRNLVIVFLLTGLWHGAAWTFVLWGAYHGAFLLIERIGLGKALEKTPAPFAHAYALLVVLFGWVLFRSPDLPHALAYYGAMFNPGGLHAPDIDLLVLLNNETVLALLLGLVFSAPTLPWLMDRIGARRLAPAGHLPEALDTHQIHVLSTPLLITGLVLSIAHLAGSSLNPFLYFRF